MKNEHVIIDARFYLDLPDGKWQAAYDASNEKVRQAEIGAGIRLYQPLSHEHSSFLVTDSEIPVQVEKITRELNKNNVVPLFFVVRNYAITAYAAL